MQVCCMNETSGCRVCVGAWDRVRVAAGTWLRSEIMHPQECVRSAMLEKGVPEEPLEQSDPFSPHGPHCGQHWQPIRYKVYSQRRSVAHSQRRSVAASIMAVHVIGRPSPARLRHVSSTHTPGALWEAGANSTTNTRRTLRKPAWMRCAIRATALVPRAIRQQRAPIGHFSDSIL